MMNESEKLVLWRKLESGDSLVGFSLPTNAGRIDLRGLSLPKPTVVRRWQTSLANVAEIQPNGAFRNIKLNNLDFSGSKLPLIIFRECEINNCCFDQCDLQDLRLSATMFKNCSFRGAKLRDAGLGVAAVYGPFAGKRNSFIDVDFSQADLRGTVYIAAAFEGCLFRQSKLVKLNFGTSTFANCRFEGELRDVIFWRSDLFGRSLAEDAFPQNEMKDIDFTSARLLDVEFRGLTLDRVLLPNDAEHIVINDFANVLDRLIASLRLQSDETARVLIAYLSVTRRWAASTGRGVLNVQSLSAAAGDDAGKRVSDFVRRVGTQVN